MPRPRVKYTRPFWGWRPRPSIPRRLPSEKKKIIKIIRAVGGYFIIAAKVLVVSKPIAIFYAGHGKS